MMMHSAHIYPPASRQSGALFLVCPDCQLEQKIRSAYGENSYFLTALGAVFERCEVTRAEELNQFLLAEDIHDIYVVNDTDCTFMKNAICREHNFHTRAEAVLKLLLRKNKALQEDPCCTVEEKAKRLAQLNIFRQSIDLMDTAYIGHKIQDHDLELHGLIYNRTTQVFEEVAMNRLNALRK
ncbi:MAG: hypothetical protein NWS63_05390 [Saprospiraceae bacterium]|nr:hypothetical protein [Saprospiraceae bacterium]